MCFVFSFFFLFLVQSFSIVYFVVYCYYHLWSIKLININSVKLKYFKQASNVKNGILMPHIVFEYLLQARRAYIVNTLRRKNGLHAFGNNSAESEPIWMRSGTGYSVSQMWRPVLPDVLRDPRSSDNLRGVVFPKHAKSVYNISRSCDVRSS